MTDRALVLGAVAYAPKVVTIWEGFKRHLVAHGLAFDFVLYSNYERLVEDQFDGRVDLAWNSPLAWVRAELIAAARGLTVSAPLMRDTDHDLTSVLVVRSGNGIDSLEQLRGKTIGFGAIDSPQARLIPLDHLRAAGLLQGRDFQARVFDVLGGKHGDHVGGELDAARALAQGEVDAAWMVDRNHLAFASDGTLPSGQTRVLARTAPFDHCNFTVSPHAPADLIDRFVNLLLAMRWDDAAVRPLLELERLREWRIGRTTGYAALKRAVQDEGFYDAAGNITASDYRY
ncbi:hypothetical protein BH10PSE17_BH10PSE17_02810 [soil metagenome]